MPPAADDLTSKDLLRRTGLSRATLNNYIALGLLPRPQVAPPGPDQGRARRLGHFPASALDRILEINQLKSAGLTMAQIVARLVPATAAAKSAAPAAAEIAPNGSPRLTLADLTHPAYLLNPNLELEWWNTPALELLGRPDGLPGPLAARNLIDLLLTGGVVNPLTDARPVDGQDMLRAILAVAKRRMPKAGLARLGGRIDATALARIEAMYDAVEAAPARPALRQRISLGGKPADLYVSFFREGSLFVHAPASADGGGLADLLGRREQVIHDLVRRRDPFYTPLAVLAAQIQDADRLCSELPAEDWFALANLTWSTLEATFRRHHATPGRHLGDAMVHFFFPQPDGNHLMNALLCAQEIGHALRDVRAQWLRRRSWPEQLTVNIGLAASTEWFGVMQSPVGHTPVALGSTMGRAQHLARAGRGGIVLATKALVAALAERDRDRVRHGIHRAGAEGRARFIAGRFARLDEIAGSNAGESAALPVTEILGVAEPVPVATP